MQSNENTFYVAMAIDYARKSRHSRGDGFARALQRIVSHTSHHVENTMYKDEEEYTIVRLECCNTTAGKARLAFVDPTHLFSSSVSQI